MNKGFLVFFYMLLGALILGFGAKTWKAVKVYFIFGNQFRATGKIAKGLLTYLKGNELLTDDTTGISVVTEQHVNGTFSIHLKGANQHDSNMFISMLEEIIAPIENPRYLLVGKNWFKKKWGIKTYFVVPTLLARNKETAISFEKVWNEHVDGSTLLYTRTLEGRKHLLKARFAHLRYEFEERSKRSTTWK